MYSVTIKGFKTLKQCQVFADWYSNQGEQDIDVWWEAKFPRLYPPTMKYSEKLIKTKQGIEFDIIIESRSDYE